MHEIGKILFVVLKKENRIYPMQIVEIITKKTMNGEQIEYMMQGGANPGSVIGLSTIEGEIFESPDELKNELISRATRSIAKLVDIAVTKANEWYTPHTTPLQQVAKEHVDTKQHKEIQQEYQYVELPDGTKAKIRNVNIPDVIQ